MNVYKTIPVDATRVITDNSNEYICNKIAQKEGFKLDTYSVYNAGIQNSDIIPSTVKNTEIRINDTKYEVHVIQSSTHNLDSTLYYRRIE